MTIESDKFARRTRQFALSLSGALLALSMISCSAFEDPVPGGEKKKPEAEQAKDLTPEEKKQKDEERFKFLRRRQKENKHVPAPRETPDQELVSPHMKPEDSKGGKEQMDKLIAPVSNPLTSKNNEEALKKLRMGGEPKFYDDFTALNGDEEIPVSLIFNGAPLVDVLSAFADVLGFNFVVDPNIKSTVTINLNSKMTRRELWNTFDRMVFMADCAVRVDGSILRIFPRNRLVNQPDSRVGNSILYYPLKYATSREAFQQIRTLLSPGGVCTDLTRPNALLLNDTESNITRLRQILDCIDCNGRVSWPRLIVPCHNVLPNKIAVDLQEILPVLGFVVVEDDNSRSDRPGAIRLVGLDRSQVLIASAPTQEILDQIREWVKLLDVAGNSDKEQVFVYKVRHNKAAHLVRALSIIFDVQGSSLTVDTNTGNTRIETINPPRSTYNSTNRTTAARLSNGQSFSAQSNIASSMLTNQESDIYTRPTRIFADGVLNRLVVRTNPRTYASIKALLDRLDVVPAQVLLQVMVVEVTLNESTQFGLEFSGAGSGDNFFSAIGTNYASNGDTNLNPFVTDPSQSKGDGGSGAPPSSVTTGPSRQNGFTGIIGDPNNPQTRFGYIRAMAGNTKIKVLSSPQILVSSNTEALVQVGSDVPVLTSTFTSTSSSGNSQQTYSYKETGIILKVTPQVTSTDLIVLEVRQELSSTVVTSYAVASPTINKRIVDTSMTVANGQTMVIGGLIQENTSDYLDSLPFINKVPFLNRLLGSTNAKLERTEILVMVTGHIVDEKSPVEDMIRRYNEAIASIEQFDRKLGDGEDADKSKPELMTDMNFWFPNAD